MMNRIVKLAVITVNAVVFSGGIALATTVDFSGSTSGFFYDVDYYEGPGNVTYSNGTWGPQVGWGQVNDQDPRQSTMEIISTPFNYMILPGTHEYVVGRIEWFNETWGNFDGYFDIDAKLSFFMTNPSSLEISDIVELQITTTDNSNVADADQAFLAKFDNYRIGVPLVLADGITLTDIVLSVTGSGEIDEFGNWITFEQGTSQLVFSAVIENEHMPPIPLPAAGWLLIAGLGSLVALRRRQAA